VLLVSFRGSVSTLDARRTIAMVLPRIEVGYATARRTTVPSCGRWVT
jgi:hypothetical protein